MISDPKLSALINDISTIMSENGPSHTSMDLLARRLHISKRTLYEIFGSKEDMIASVLVMLRIKFTKRISNALNTSENAMEAMVRTIKIHQDELKNTSTPMLRDLSNEDSPLRRNLEHIAEMVLHQLKHIHLIGIRQGVFRESDDFDIQVRLLRVQMESLKRMEEFFPPGITLPQAYRIIAHGFLRSLATPNGLIILENLIKEQPDINQ
ncbi:MAG: TetR/AcrR family transcriptional regulator [Muribaculaceae bacterium]|nr:TetR/AcrR family transcriptional regulator [Muribaculaceae bacterium]